MTEEREKARSRSIEVELEIRAPLEAVWKALTDAQEISRWFSPQAQVEPGVGGSIRWTWDEEIDWESRIEIWETNRHLRAVYDRSSTSSGSVGTPAVLAMDFYLEARGSRTVLRLVHSGFGPGTDWEEEYDGVRRGWGFELGALRHYLEHHRGEPRRFIWARVPLHGSEEDAWARLMGPQGLLRQGLLDDPGEGAPYAITAATGDTFQGNVLIFDPPYEFGGTVENLNNALFRVAVERCGRQPQVWVSLASYGLPEQELASFHQRWTSLLEQLFPEEKTT